MTTVGGSSGSTGSTGTDSLGTLTGSDGFHVGSVWEGFFVDPDGGFEDPIILADGGEIPTSILVFATDDAVDSCSDQASFAFSGWPDGGPVMNVNSVLQTQVFDPHGVPLNSPYTSLTQTQENIDDSDGGLPATAWSQTLFFNATSFEGSVEGTVALAVGTTGLLDPTYSVTMQGGNATGILDGGTDSLSGSLSVPGTCVFGYTH